MGTYEELLSRGRVINPNFAIASENWFDRVLPYVDVSYMRLEDIDMPSTAMRYTFPEWTGTIFGESPGRWACVSARASRRAEHPAALD